MIILAIFVTCGLGAIVRYRFSYLNSKFSIPVGTLVANLVAAFLMGYFSQHIKNPMLLTILATGFLGGLGTYSTLNHEFIVLFKDKKKFLVYMGLTYLLGMICVFLGILI